LTAKTVTFVIHRGTTEYRDFFTVLRWVKSLVSPNTSKFTPFYK